MKTNDFVKLCMPGLLILALFAVSCGKHRETPGEKVAVQLLEYLNREMPGSNFKTDMGKALVKPEPGRKNRFQVTFKNLSLTGDLVKIAEFIDIDIVKSLPLGNSSDLKLENCRVNEIVFLYGPEEKFVKLQSIMGFSYDMHPPKEETWKIGNFKIDKIRFSMGNKTFNNPGIDDIIKDLKPLGIMRNLKFEAIGVLGKKDDFSIILEIEEIGSSYGEGIEDHSIGEESDAPNIDIKLELGRVKISMKKNGKHLGSGAINHLYQYLFLKPDETRNFYKFGFSFGIKNLKLYIPGKKKIELLSDIEECRFNFSLEHLDSKAVLAFNDIFKNDIQSMDWTAITPQALKFGTGIMTAKPLLKCSLSPFKHYFGEIELKMQVGLTNLLSMPDAKISVNLYKIDNILKKLGKADVLPPLIMNAISLAIEKNAVRKENGDAVIIIETKANEPGKFFLNGKPITIDPKILF
jgi:hypothetical protein